MIGSYGGKKIEICNTDAEGRLILADAMAYMVKDEHADRVIDIATLTGAVVGMLGFSTAGLLSDDDAFCGAFLKAAQTSGERYWRLPIFEEQKQMIESKIADIKNMGRDYCGTITAVCSFRRLPRDVRGSIWISREPHGQTIRCTRDSRRERLLREHPACIICWQEEKRHVFKRDRRTYPEAVCCFHGKI